MHHCLHVAEIVDLIAQFAESSSSKASPCPTIALSQTCKAFYEPAVNIHWRTLESLKPLMACFPSDVCAPDEKGVYHFKRSPLPGDWERFRHHASRVRVLHCSDDNLGIGATEYHVLETCRPDLAVPLLPHLNELYWDDFRALVAPFVRVFIQPSLTMFHVISISNPRLIATFLEDLAERAPLLRHLRVRSPGPSSGGPLIANALSKALPSLRYLTDVWIRANLNETHLMQLSKLPSLEVLCAPLDPDVDPTHLFSDRKETFFPSLVRLDVNARHIFQVIPLLRAISSPNLRKVGVHLETQPSSLALEEFFSVASSHKVIHELSVLIISARSPDRNLRVGSSDYLLTNDTLRPLLQLRNLARLYMVQMPFKLSDNFIRDAATAWTCLESLTFGTMVRSRTSGITLEGLRPLADQCRALRELAIAVDIVPHKMSNKDDPIYSGESQLKTFDIGCTSVVDDQRLVHFVADVFPRAQICDTQGSLDRSRKRLLEKLNSGVARTQDGSESE